MDFKTPIRAERVSEGTYAALEIANRHRKVEVLFDAEIGDGRVCDD